MIHPFFDPSSLSNQELQDKINEVSIRIANARTAGIKYEIVQSMFTVINSCEQELINRQAKNDLDVIKKENNNCIFDTDNYVNENNEEKNESTRKSQYKRGW